MKKKSKRLNSGLRVEWDLVLEKKKRIKKKQKQYSQEWEIVGPFVVNIGKTVIAKSEVKWEHVKKQIWNRRQIINDQYVQRANYALLILVMAIKKYLII